jgi:hypothetical protein
MAAEVAGKKLFRVPSALYAISASKNKRNKSSPAPTFGWIIEPATSRWVLRDYFRLPQNRGMHTII